MTERADGAEQGTERGRPAISTCLGAAMLFEALTVVATQDKTVRAASPWQADPFDAMVSLAQFTVPALWVVIVLRLLVWRWPGAPDRARQTLRAAVVLVVLLTATLAFEWAAVAMRVEVNAWNDLTSLLIGGLVLCTAATAVAMALVAVHYRSWMRRAPWTHDWLEDAGGLAARLPGLRRLAGPRTVAVLRGHAITAFVLVSAVSAVLVIGALAVGEQWTDPLLAGWALGVETMSTFCVCMVGNAVAGFVARPRRGPVRRAVEIAVTAGCGAVQVAVAFRDPIWRALTGFPVTAVSDLVIFTYGAGAVTAVAVFTALQWLDPRAPSPVPSTVRKS